ASAIRRRPGGHDRRPGGAASPAHPSPLPSGRRGAHPIPVSGGSVMARLLGLALGLGALAAALVRADEPRLPAARPAGKLELVATFTGPMPTGVTVSRS